MKEVFTKSHSKIYLMDFPSECPHCHKSISPETVYGHFNKSDIQMEVLLNCPDLNCCKSFIAYYDIDNKSQSYYTGIVSQGSIKGRSFSETICNVSENFIQIYNQAFAAEQQNLTEICGVGFRKALEFLIKDYAIKKNPDKKEQIEAKLLGKCIDDYIDNLKIKSVAKRAAWLGNDQTHYVKKWEGQNLSGLKKLIDLTVHWIEMEELTSSFEEEMPE